METRTEQQVNKSASTAMTLGIIGMVAWLLPIAGIPITIIAIVKGSGNLEATENASKAKTGMILGIVGLVLSGINAIAGMMMATM